MKSAMLTVAMVGLSACALDVGAQRVELDLRVAGTAVEAGFEGRDGARISLDRADLAFGPLYICRSAEAGESCETAALEWTDAAVVDALAPDPTGVGRLTGIEGRVRSFMYDLGLHSVLTQQEPLVLPAARELGGSSVVLEGEAEQGGRTLPFRFEVAVAQTPETTQGAPVVVSSQRGAFDENVDASSRALTVVFDPRTWLTNVRFDAFVDDRTCADAEPPAEVCAADVWQTCDGSGGVSEEVDCAAQGRVCVAGRGCQDAFVAPEGSQAWLAIRNALVSGERPEFRWSEAD